MITHADGPRARRILYNLYIYILWDRICVALTTWTPPLPPPIGLPQKAEYLFFYIPTVIILGLVIPAFTTIYCFEETVASTMTVKVTGRQWYWWPLHG